MRQSISQVFDRIVVPTPPANTLLFSQENVSDKVDELEPFCLDGWRLFQDLCNFSAGDNPQWLVGLNQARVQRSFCLEMIESLLEQYSSLFVNIPQFNFLLKEKINKSTVYASLFTIIGVSISVLDAHNAVNAPQGNYFVGLFCGLFTAAALGLNFVLLAQMHL